jgi:hypothetical protein
MRKLLEAITHPGAESRARNLIEGKRGLVASASFFRRQALWLAVRGFLAVSLLHVETLGFRAAFRVLAVDLVTDEECVSLSQLPLCVRSGLFRFVSCYAQKGG